MSQEELFVVSSAVNDADVARYRVIPNPNCFLEEPFVMGRSYFGRLESLNPQDVLIHVNCVNPRLKSRRARRRPTTKSFSFFAYLSPLAAIADRVSLCMNSISSMSTKMNLRVLCYNVLSSHVSLRELFAVEVNRGAWKGKIPHSPPVRLCLFNTTSLRSHASTLILPIACDYITISNVESGSFAGGKSSTGCTGKARIGD